MCEIITFSSREANRVTDSAERINIIKYFYDYCYPTGWLDYVLMVMHYVSCFLGWDLLDVKVGLVINKVDITEVKG